MEGDCSDAAIGGIAAGSLMIYKVFIRTFIMCDKNGRPCLFPKIFEKGGGLPFFSPLVNYSGYSGSEGLFEERVGNAVIASQAQSRRG